jgi:allophanate hydrolase
MTFDVIGWSIDDYADAYRAGATACEIVATVLGELQRAPRGVLIGEPCHERALEHAVELDAAGPDGLPLFGVPFLVKDNIDVGGIATTAACPGYSYVATRDATVVSRLRSAGAVVVGKSNLDQFATGLVGTRSPYGTPPNTLDATLVPGGSSSGSAVAVALGLVPFALGTDTAGSGRVPAALNGIVGLKPTVGRLSTTGIVPAVRRLDCPSVFARSVADASRVARLMELDDPNDPFQRTPPAPSTRSEAPTIGIPETWPAMATPSQQMVAWFDSAVERLRSLGFAIRSVDLGPFLEIGALLYGSSLVAERWACVGDAISKRVDGLDPTVVAIVARGQEYSAPEAYRTEYELVSLRTRAALGWEGLDAIALPTTVDLPTLTEVAADPIGRNEEVGRLTSFVNLLDQAAVVVPIATGVPAGLQLLARAWDDDLLVEIASAFEQHRPIERRLPPARIVVVGAHLEGMPLHHQLTERGAVLVSRTRTSADYRLYELGASPVPKPGLLRVPDGSGSEIDVELWALGDAELGSFVQLVPSPLCVGSVRLHDGTAHPGFLCESVAIAEARDISEFGGWRNFLASR